MTTDPCIKENPQCHTVASSRFPQLRYGLGPCKTHALCRDLLTCLDERYPAHQSMRLSVVVDNDTIHQAKKVEPWLATHPQVTLLLLPTYCPQANPIERAYGVTTARGTISANAYPRWWPV
jgi:DDE superfamily endonuclease